MAVAGRNSGGIASEPGKTSLLDPSLGHSLGKFSPPQIFLERRYYPPLSWLSIWLLKKGQKYVGCMYLSFFFCYDKSLMVLEDYQWIRPPELPQVTVFSCKANDAVLFMMNVREILQSVRIHFMALPIV